MFYSFNPNHAYWNQRRLFSGNLRICSVFFKHLEFLVELVDVTSEANRWLLKFRPHVKSIQVNLMNRNQKQTETESPLFDCSFQERAGKLVVKNFALIKQYF